MHNRQVQALHNAAHLVLAAVEQRADLRDAAAVEVRHRLEATDPPLEEQVHQQRLNRVVVVVAERDLGDAQLLQRRVETAAAEFGAERAGILLLPLLKDDLIDRRLDPRIGYVQTAAELRHLVEALSRRPGLERDGVDGKRLRIKAAQLRQRRQRQQAVLPARDAHSHRVAGVDHVIVLHTAADKPQNMLHQ